MTTPLWLRRQSSELASFETFENTITDDLSTSNAWEPADAEITETLQSSLTKNCGLGVFHEQEQADASDSVCESPDSAFDEHFDGAASLESLIAEMVDNSIEDARKYEQDPNPSLQAPVLTKRKSPEPEELTDGDATTSESERESKSPRHSARGRHVTTRPAMPAIARRGQVHWRTCRDTLRKAWENRKIGDWDAQYKQQIRMCSRAHIKSQHECLLRSLQIAAVDGLILPAPFHDKDEESFLGWTGFQVVRQHSAEFRRRIEDLFERPPKDNTLNNCLRRAGFGPSILCWDQAWCGLASFEYSENKRARYGRQD